MFSILYGRKVEIHVLLAAVFGATEFAATRNSVPSTETCVPVSGESSCYFKVHEKPEDWHNATRLCNTLDATLPVIRNKQEQDAVAAYLKSDVTISFAWTAGIKIIHKNWTWTNGEPLTDYVKVNPSQLFVEELLEVAAYTVLKKDFEFTALAASDKMPYICQFNGTYCKSSDVKQRTDSCLRVSNDSETWYDARYQCLTTGGDLAVISKDDHSLLKKQLTLNSSFWIGLKMKSWVWKPNYNATSNDEIKYTNWDGNAFSRIGDCIAIHALDGKWKGLGCNEPLPVVCRKAVSIESTTNESSGSGSQSTTNGLPGSGSQSLYYAAIGAGIVIIICIIVIVVFVLSTRKKSAKESSRSKFTGSSQRNDHEAYERRIASAPGTASVYERAGDMLGAYAEIRLSTLDQSECQAESQQPRIVYTATASANEPANAPVNTSDDMRGTYAGIPLSTHTKFEDGETNQQPGTVYAALEFEKVPNAKHPYSATPTKMGPLGGVYALPDVKVNGTTSPGASSSHPIMVSATGDVYALPTKTTKSPTANHPENVVYANLPAEQNVQTNL